LINSAYLNELTPDQIYSLIESKKVYSDSSDSNLQAAKLAASLANAQARDGALVDPKEARVLLNSHVNKRHLLSDFDYDVGNSNDNSNNNSNESSDSSSERKHKSANLNLNKSLSSNNNESMDLVLVNGTWRLIDLNICYKMLSANNNSSKSSRNFNTRNNYQNHTHLNKYDN
jgi:hypothetical protein